MRLFLLEDNPADARLMRVALDELDVEVIMDHVADVAEAKDHFDACRAGDIPAPDLAVLDIRLPAGSGHEVLRHIRSMARFTALPVLMLTTSDDADDIEEAREHGATTYFLKPPDLDGFMDLVRELAAFWFPRTDAPPAS